MAPARWPGWTRRHTLLLPVLPAHWPPPDAPVAIDGLTLHPKHELHITLVGTRLGKALRDAARSGAIDRDAVRTAFEREDWRWTRCGRRTLLHAPPSRGGGPPRHALIEHVDLPAMPRFHAVLGTLLGRALPVPPPHVTLYVAGTDQGIGVPDPQTLARLAAGSGG
ncbi:MAG TPA: hypothetical protein VFM73_09655 [Xanthomonadaceae bacterium]|nr:hypothetical protein [Xanthomonadaceae bacterium]